jgi:sporulation protein YlmC with PRC-barrel domain
MEITMVIKNSIIAFTFATALFSAGQSFSQTAAGVDPACMVKNADGTETVDKVKCPDGMKVGAGSTTGSTTAPAQTNAATAQSNPNATSLIIPADSFAGSKVISASDFIGKRVYTKAGEDIGEVNDLIMTDNGSVRAVILGVGGFLGIGEKDVAVAMAAIDVTQDGSTSRLVVDGSKEQFNAAPKYDRSTRTYLQ